MTIVIQLYFIQTNIKLTKTRTIMESFIILICTITLLYIFLKNTINHV